MPLALSAARWLTLMRGRGSSQAPNLTNLLSAPRQCQAAQGLPSTPQSRARYQIPFKKSFLVNHLLTRRRLGFVLFKTADGPAVLSGPLLEILE